MNEFNIKTKTAGKCRVYPDSPNGLQPSVTSICGALMKCGLIDWAANCAVDYIWCSGKRVINERGGGVYAEEAVFDTARKAHEIIRDNAADFGTQAHLVCQLWLEDKKDQIGTAQKEYFDALMANDMSTDEAGKWLEKVVTLFDSFCTWAIKNKIEPVHTEIKLHGDGYSGRCDLIAYRTCPKTGERRLGLYDIKTGKGSYYPEWGLQLAAYAEAYDAGLLNGDYDGMGIDVSANHIGLDEIGIIKLNKDTLKCNFSEQSKPKFTADRDRLTNAWEHLVKFYWSYNDIETQFKEMENESAECERQEVS